MIEHCKQGLPNEACGFLAAAYQKPVSRIYPLTNAAASPVFYRPADREMIDSLADMDRYDTDLVAIYHSHVASDPYPSPTDQREAHYPDSVYIIVSLTEVDNPVTRGYLIHKKDWRDENGEIEEVTLVVS